MSKKSNQYFTQETQDAIIEYNNTSDPEERKRIFEEHIHYPFYKLIENIIHTFKLRHTDTETIEDLKHKLISILLEEKIHKFDPSIGAKAYSYFGTIVKRWLINYSNKNYRDLKNIGTWEEYKDPGTLPVPFDESGALTLSQLVDEFVKTSYRNINTLFPKEKDREIADALLIIFEKREGLQLFKKKAVYLYIKEITDCKTVELTRVVSVLKKEFYSLLKDKQERGLFIE